MVELQQRMVELLEEIRDIERGKYEDFKRDIARAEEDRKQAAAEAFQHRRRMRRDLYILLGVIVIGIPLMILFNVFMNQLLSSH